MRLGGKVSGDDVAEDDDIYMDILRDQEAKKKAKKLKKEKKKEKKEKKKSKKRKEVESDVEEKSEVDSDEELYRFFEDPPESKPQKRKSKELVSPTDIKKKFVRAKFDNDLDLLDEDLDTERQKKSKIKRRTSNEVRNSTNMS